MLDRRLGLGNDAGSRVSFRQVIDHTIGPNHANTFAISHAPTDCECE